MPRADTPFTDRLDPPPAPLALGTAFLTFSMLAVCELWVPPYFSLTPFHLLNIAFVSWACGRTWGVLLALLAAGAQMLLRFDHSGLAHLIYFYVNHISTLVAYIALAMFIAAMRAMYEREQTHARSDFLTNTLNRRGLHEVLTAEIARAQRSGKPVSVAYMDFDNFKALNDTAGHMAGDDALKTVAKRAKSVLRKSDFLARLGGDEFAVVFPDTNAQGAADAVNKLRGELDKSMTEKGFAVTFSFGVVTFDSPPSSPEEVLSVCDSLLYDAKSNGKRAMAQRTFSKG